MGQVRIIGGEFRRAVLPVPSVVGLRPTSDRVRETLFNWLGQTLPPIAVLDAFAGTGALGFEAISRGAAHLDAYELNPVLVKNLQQSWHILQGRTRRQVAVRIHGCNVCQALAVLRRNGAPQYDLILLDPPFATDLLQRILPVITALLAPNGLIYIEWHESCKQEPLWVELLATLKLEVMREQRAGQVYYHLLRFSKPLS